MFETAEIGRKVAKATYNKQVPLLRLELLEVQQELRQAGFPAIVLFGGVDAAGKSETVNLLNEWMDPRWLTTSAYVDPSDEEKERPEFWRYWRDLPPKGQIGLFQSAWYSRAIRARVYGGLSDAGFDKALERIETFEKELADDGTLILKFWLHLSREGQKKRFKALESDPLTSWRVAKTDWENLKHYDDFVAASERAIARTSTGEAPWHIVEGYDLRYCGLSVAETLRDALQKHLREAEIKQELVAQMQIDESLAQDEPAAAPKKGNGADEDAGAGVVLSPRVTILSRLDMNQTLSKSDYRTQLAKYQAKLHKLNREAIKRKLSSIFVFEGWDAAGKGGAIRRMTQALDARSYRVIPIAAPTDEENQHHYLWRFWRHISRAGRVTMFDRSWYGRVLVERVEGFASEAEWRRAYGEINDFEEQLVNHGILLLKFWVHVTPEEQLVRFKSREEVPYKRWKLTDEDWRNREKWGDYEEAVNDMIERTSTASAPWTLVEGNDKRFSRVKVIQTVCDSLEERLKAEA
ncbi:MAG: polyphosphate:AMP phosphotransferase [Alphaproteobacteria bacterium]|nr:polyphosphate:AMP phosphotransferase [Alphaproteobacteria bacterium]